MNIVLERWVGAVIQYKTFKESLMYLPAKEHRAANIGISANSSVRGIISFWVTLLLQPKST